VAAPLLSLGLLLLNHPWPAFAVLLSAHALLFTGMLVPSSPLLGPVITSFATPERDIWLTIDDGPDPADTPVLLDLLDKAGAKATFFFIGEKAATHPELVDAVLAAGHAVGNHTWSHPATSLWASGPATTRREIGKAADFLTSRPGACPSLPFRAPAGLKNPWMHGVLGSANPPVAWSARGLDGIKDEMDGIINRIMATLRPGGIVLMHEGRRARDGSRLAPEVLRRLLTEWKGLGWKTVVPAPEKWRYATLNPFGTPRGNC
jgi:peptidoglycan/xylan/chitin deacetylase (PgdA/CDA1 family)